MGIKRGLIGTENAKHQLDVIYESEYFGKVGLIVGQRTSGNHGDYAVYFARTPSETSDDPEEAAKKDLLSDVTWMTEHVKQVTRMLPGGLAVLGVVAAEPSFTGQRKSLVETLLTFIDKNHQKTSLINPETDDNYPSANNYYVMNVDRQAKATSNNVVDISSMTWKPCDLKFEDHSGTWQVVQSNFLLDNYVFFPSETGNGINMADKFSKTLERVKHSLQDATVLFDNTFREGSKGQFLDPEAKKAEPKKGKGKSSKREQSPEPEAVKSKKKIFNAEILLDDNSFDDDELEIQTAESGSRLRLTGKMTVRVFLHPEATVKEAEAAIKEDVFRTLSARLDIHIDSLDLEDKNEIPEEAHNPAPVIHEPPRRCLIQLPNFKKNAAADDEDNESLKDDDEDETFPDMITVSDFLFPGETPYESIESVKEVFGFIPSIEMMDDDQELVASPQQMVPPSPPGAVPVPGPDPESMKRERAKKFNTLAFALSGVVLLIGLAISYFSIGGNDLEVSIDKQGETGGEEGPLPTN